MTRPSLSVLVDTYNHERYIEQAIVSVLDQDFPASDVEVVLVDDGSTDRTPEIVRKFVPRVRLLRKKNGGQASAFNAGIAELKGSLVAFLDGDDWFAPGKLTAVVETLQKHPEVAAVGHGYYEFNEETKQTRVCAPPDPKLLHLGTPEAAREAYRGWPFLLMGALTVRREVLETVVPIPEKLLFCADTPITMASMAGSVYVLEQPLFYYRHHADNYFVTAENNAARLKRRYDMTEETYRLTEPILARLNVPPESIAALLYPPWITISRLSLQRFGGNPLNTFRTEMRFFRLHFDNPSIAYRLFKYLFVGSATLLLPPRRFYQARDWYYHRNLARFRERLCKTE